MFLFSIGLCRSTDVSEPMYQLSSVLIQKIERYKANEIKRYEEDVCCIILYHPRTTIIVIMTEYINEYKVGVVVSLENCTSSTKGGKALKVCHVNIGDPDQCITVVTAAPNVREGSRYVNPFFLNENKERKKKNLI